MLVIIMVTGLLHEIEAIRQTVRQLSKTLNQLASKSKLPKNNARDLENDKNSMRSPLSDAKESKQPLCLL